MAMASQALDSNNHALVRTALQAVYAVQLQTQLQRARRGAKQPGAASCDECGARITVRERRKPGQPMYCRNQNRCKMRAYRRRKRQQAEAAGRTALVTVTASQIPEVLAGPGSGPGPLPAETPEPSPAELWLAMRAG